MTIFQESLPFSFRDVTAGAEPLSVGHESRHGRPGKAYPLSRVPCRIGQTGIRHHMGLSDCFTYNMLARLKKKAKQSCSGIAAARAGRAIWVDTILPGHTFIFVIVYAFPR